MYHSKRVKPLTAGGFSPSKIQTTKSSEKSPRKTSPDDQQSPTRVKPLDFSSLSPCYKLFRQEKKSHTYMNTPQSISTNRTRKSERTTMTGLTKDQVYFHSIQNLALSCGPSHSSSQINLLGSPTMASMVQLESPQTTRIRPQFSVKSFTHMEVPNLVESATSLIYSLKDCSPMLTPMGGDGGSLSPIKDSRAGTAIGTGKIRKGTSQMKRKLNKNFTDSPGSNTDKASIAITLTPLLSPWGGQSVRGGEYGTGGFTERAEGLVGTPSGSQTSRAGKRVHIKSKTAYRRSGFFSAEQTPKIGGSLLFEGGGSEAAFGLGEKVMRGTQMKTVVKEKNNENKINIMRSSLILEKNK